MKKVNLKSFKSRREKKNCIKVKVVTKQNLDELKDNYTFNNWGVTAIDLSEYDFSNLSLKDMTKIPFSTTTIWPEESKLPLGFKPQEVLAKSVRTSKEVKDLHKEGFDGTGISVAVIDSGFQAEKHIEFSDASLIKATNSQENFEYHHHMENVLSKLCGKNLGIAPKSKVYYYETSMEEDLSKETMLALKDILLRIKNGKKIRIVNCSYTVLDETNKYYEDCKNLIKQLAKLKCEVIDSARFAENFFCCGTDFLNENDDMNKFKPCSFAKGKPYEEDCKQAVNIICSGRAVLEFSNNNGYKYETIDCFSWTIPQCVGYYALALQVNPDLTFEDFAEICKETSDVNKNGLRILNISSLIYEIKQNIIKLKD